MKEMTVQHERLNQKKLETTKGWYSEVEMRDELGWKPNLISTLMHDFRLSSTRVI